MLITVNSKSKIPIFKQLIDGIKTLIASGEIMPGSQLPSIRELAVNLRLNPNTVARAYKQLELEGFVETKRGIGVFVKSIGKESINMLKSKILEEKILDVIRMAKQFNISKEELINKINKKFREEL